MGGPPMSGWMDFRRLRTAKFLTPRLDQLAEGVIVVVRVVLVLALAVAGSASIEAVEGFHFGIKGGKEARDEFEELAGGAEFDVVVEGGLAGGGEDDVGGGG